jgi:O-antigen/teichoic acid export membrane protein
MGIIFRIRRSAFLTSLLAGLSLFLLCLVFMLFTNPAKVSLVALLIPFVLLGGALFLLINAVILGVFQARASVKARRFWAGVSAFFVVTMLLLQSLNQFTLRDFLILVVLILTLGLYVARTDFGSN